MQNKCLEDVLRLSAVHYGEILEHAIVAICGPSEFLYVRMVRLSVVDPLRVDVLECISEHSVSLHAKLVRHLGAPIYWQSVVHHTKSLTHQRSSREIQSLTYQRTSRSGFTAVPSKEHAR